MINLNTINSSQSVADFNDMMDWLSAAADPKKAKEQIRLIREAANESPAVLASASNLRAEVAAAHAQLDADRKSQEEKLAADRAEFKAECDRRKQALSDREAEIAKLEALARVSRDDAARDAADIQQRLERIRSAAAA